MMQSFLRLQQVDAGVRTDRVLSVYVSRFVTKAARQELAREYTDVYERVMERFSQLPGVTQVGAGYNIPYDSSGPASTVV